MSAAEAEPASSTLIAAMWSMTFGMARPPTVRTAKLFRPRT
jgi:hypothetical protein